MQLFIVEGENRAVKSLFSDESISLPPFQQSTYPFEVTRVRRIASPTDAQIFEPIGASTDVVQVGLGTGYTLPTAGVWTLGFGILTSGTVTNGKRYRIRDFNAGDSFTNIGAGSNATGQVFTATGTTPTTWTNGSELIEITADLDFDNTDAELQTALNNLASVNAAGGVTVLENVTGLFTVTFNNAGSRADMEGYTENLAPESLVEVGTLVNGTSLLREIQSVRVTQNPVGLKTLDSAITAATGTVSEVTVGGAGLNAKVRLTLDPLPYGGSFTLTVRGVESALLDADASAEDIVAALEGLELTSGLLVTGAKYKIVTFVAGDNFSNLGATNATGSVFIASGTTPTTWTNGSTLSPVASGNVEVIQEAANRWLIAFVGDMANTAMGTITTDSSSLLSIAGRAGTMDTRTAGAGLLLGNSDQADVTFAVVITPQGETPSYWLSLESTIVAPVIPPASGDTVPTGGVYDTVTGAGPYRFTIVDGVISYDLY